ncbi:MAG: PucR family transcriptional regulator, partial [Nocardioides sp.]|nr:PucR family transcriptional regulator [Nocardioides sp.]
MSGVAEWIEEWERRERTPEAVAAWVDMVAASVEESAPESGGDLRPLLRASTEQHWLAFIDHLTQGAPVHLPAAARAYALEVAQRHLGLAVLVKAYRGAQQASWRYVTDQVRSAPAEVDHEELLIALWGATAAWYDNAVEESIVIHQKESRRIEQRGDAQRYAVVSALLEGEEADTPSVSTALGGYALSGSHVALIAHAVTPDAVGFL